MQLPSPPELRKQSELRFFGRALAMAVGAEVLLSGMYTYLILYLNMRFSTSMRVISPDIFLGAVVIINIVTLPLGIVTALVIAARLYTTPARLDRRTATWLGVETAMVGFLIVLLLIAQNNPLMLCLMAGLLFLTMTGRMGVRTMFGIVILLQIGQLGINEVLTGSGGGWLFYSIFVLIPGFIYLICAAWATPRLNQYLWLLDDAGSDRPRLMHT